MQTRWKLISLVAVPLVLFALIYNTMWGFYVSSDTLNFRRTVAGTTEIRVLGYNNQVKAILTGSKAQRFINSILIEKAPQSNGYGVDTKFCFFKGKKLVATVWPLTSSLLIIDTLNPTNQLPDNYEAPARAKTYTMKLGTSRLLRAYERF